MCVGGQDVPAAPPPAAPAWARPFPAPPPPRLEPTPAAVPVGVAGVYASDHAPIVADLEIVLSRAGKARLARRRKLLGLSYSSRPPFTPREVLCLGVCGAVALGLIGVVVWLLWDLFAANLECRVQCRNKADDPPFDTPINSSRTCS